MYFVSMNGVRYCNHDTVATCFNLGNLYVCLCHVSNMLIIMLLHQVRKFEWVMRIVSPKADIICIVFILGIAILTVVALAAAGKVQDLLLDVTRGSGQFLLGGIITKAEVDIEVVCPLD